MVTPKSKKTGLTEQEDPNEDVVAGGGPILEGQGLRSQSLSGAERRTQIFRVQYGQKVDVMADSDYEATHRISFITDSMHARRRYTGQKTFRQHE